MANDLKDTLKRPDEVKGASQSRTPASRSPKAQSSPLSNGNLGGVLDKQQADRGSQMAALQSQIIRAQNDASKMTVMVSHQVAQVKEDLADLIESQYGGLPENWLSLKAILPEVEQYLGEEYTPENKFLLQEGAFVLIAGRQHREFLLGVQPITIYDMPALAGYQNTPALGPVQ